MQGRTGHVRGRREAARASARLQPPSAHTYRTHAPGTPMCARCADIEGRIEHADRYATERSGGRHGACVDMHGARPGLAPALNIRNATQQVHARRSPTAVPESTCNNMHTRTCTQVHAWTCMAPGRGWRRRWTGRIYEMQQPTHPTWACMACANPGTHMQQHTHIDMRTGQSAAPCRRPGQVHARTRRVVGDTTGAKQNNRKQTRRAPIL